MQTRVATLWIGKTLSFLERLSLKSFADIGQTPILYLYDPVEDPPAYAEIRDAREVLDESFIQRFWGKDRLDDPRIQSDLFRVLLMQRTPHIWVDADVYALHPHVAQAGYLFAARRQGFIPNGVMRVPAESPALALIMEFVSARGRIPPWWRPEQIAAYQADHETPSFETLPVGAIGPEAFGHFLFQTGEARFGLPFHALYPILARQSVTILQTPSPHDLAAMRARSMSLHLYATGLRRRLTRQWKGVPPEGSLLDQLCRAHQIEPVAHPVFYREDKASIERFRHLNRL